MCHDAPCCLRVQTLYSFWPCSVSRTLGGLLALWKALESVESLRWYRKTGSFWCYPPAPHSESWAPLGYLFKGSKFFQWGSCPCSSSCVALLVTEFGSKGPVDPGGISYTVFTHPSLASEQMKAEGMEWVSDLWKTKVYVWVCQTGGGGLEKSMVFVWHRGNPEPCSSRLTKKEPAPPESWPPPPTRLSPRIQVGLPQEFCWSFSCSSGERSLSQHCLGVVEPHLCPACSGLWMVSWFVFRKTSVETF